jgi:Domain of unknown function (DUF5122) beta-propeller
MFFGFRKARRSASTRRRTAPYRPRLEVLENRCLLSAGALDSTFGSGGTVTTDFGRGSTDYANALAIYPNAGTGNDGKIVVFGNGGKGYELARYNSSGALDSTFGSGKSGKVSD